MRRLPFILCSLLCLGIASLSSAQLLPSARQGEWKLRPVPVDNLFEGSSVLDMQADADGVIWILGAYNVYYLVNEGVYAYKTPEANVGPHINYISNPKSNSVQFVSRYAINEIKGIHEPIKTIDLRSTLALDNERFIRHAQRDEDGTILLLIGDDETRALWRIESDFTQARLVTQDLQLHNWFTLLDDSILLCGSDVEIVIEAPDGSVVLRPIDVSHLDRSAQNYLKIHCADEQYVYMRGTDKQGLVYDQYADSIYSLLPGSKLAYMWLDDRGELICLDQNQGLRNASGERTLDIAAQNYAVGEGATALTPFGSRGFTIGSDMYISSAEGLTMINRQASDFRYTAIGDEMGRVTNVIEDPSTDRVYVLSAGEGIAIYSLSNRELIKRIPTDEKGRPIQGFKWERMDGELYIYGLNGLYRFNLQTLELKQLIDPFLVNGDTLANRFNTMACIKQRQEIVLGTKDNRLMRYRPSDGRTVVISIPKQSEGRNLVYEVDVLPDGNVMALTERGFFHLDMERNICQPATEIYPNIPRERYPAMSGLKVMTDSSMLISSLGRGLFVYDFISDSTYRPIGDAFRSANVSDIFFDGLATVYGASHMGLLSYHIPSNTVRLIEIDEGVNTQSIHYRYMYSDAPGELILGLMKGYVKFNTHDLEKSSDGELLFNAILINGTPYQYESSKLKEIRLDYTQNNLQLTPNSTVTGRLKSSIYQERLIGLYDDWRTVVPGQAIRYDALAPGEYRCEIVDINSEEKKLSLDIIIKAPFWKQAWFIALAVFLIGSVLFTIFRLRMAYVRKENKLKAQHQLELARLEMQSLRAQMNPHFLFNSLNSIKSFIAQNEPRIATRYLTKFSHLIRLILNNSRETQVSLEQELKALELYIELEQLRFEHSFDYEIHIEKGLDGESLMLPPLILQPYVENAIWHGLLHKDGDRQLYISIKTKGDDLVATIRDNGIGRKAAKHIKSKTATKHKSLGMAITADRIEKVHEGLGSQGVEIKDLKNAAGEAIGTEVIIHLPMRTKKP